MHCTRRWISCHLEFKPVSRETRFLLHETHASRAVEPLNQNRSETIRVDIKRFSCLLSPHHSPLVPNGQNLLLPSYSLQDKSMASSSSSNLKFYPLDARPSFAKHSQSTLYGELAGKTVICSHAPHDLPRDIGDVVGEVRQLLMFSGLLNFEVMKNPTYDPLCLEFVSTWEEIMEGDVIVGWRFRIGSEPFTMYKDEVCGVLGFEPRGQMPEFFDCTLSRAWSNMSGMDEYDSNCSAKCIEAGMMKYMHRIISVNFNTRKDKAARVSKDDLSLLTAITTGGIEVDYFGVLTKQLRVWRNPRSKNRAIGGGTFITAIAKSKGFRFDESRGMMYWVDKDSLVRDRLLDPRNLRWIHIPVLPKSETGRSSIKIGSRSGIVWEQEGYPAPSLVTGIPRARQHFVGGSSHGAIVPVNNYEPVPLNTHTPTPIIEISDDDDKASWSTDDSLEYLFH